MDTTRDTRIDWAAVLAGAAVTTAIGLVLTTFGIGVGLSVTSPYEGEGAAPALYAIGAGLWVLAIQLIAFGIGAYICARLRARQTELSEHEVDVRDGLHGIIVWGVGVIAAGIIAYTVVGGVTTAAESADPGQGGMIESVAAAADAELDQAAVGEVVDNPEAFDETFAERRAEVARKLSVISAFVTAASLLAGAVMAFFAAGIGGRHRDEQTHLRFFVQRRAAPTYAPHAPTPPPQVPPAR